MSQWIGIEQHALVLRPLTLELCCNLTQGHSCLWACKRCGQKLSCGEALATVAPSPF
jgi:hypothetical protein